MKRWLWPAVVTIGLTPVALVAAEVPGSGREARPTGTVGAAAAPATDTCFAEPMKLLPFARVGQTIDDGAGYGGIRLAYTEIELLSRWGGSECRVESGRTIYTYVLGQDLNTANTAVVVSLADDRVEWIMVMLLPHARPPFPPVRTQRGVGLASPIEDVEAAYGQPVGGSPRALMYPSHGVTFASSRGFVYAIATFKADAPPGSWRSAP